MIEAPSIGPTGRIAASEAQAIGYLHEIAVMYITAAAAAAGLAEAAASRRAADSVA